MQSRCGTLFIAASFFLSIAVFSYDGYFFVDNDILSVAACNAENALFLSSIGETSLFAIEEQGAKDALWCAQFVKFLEQRNEFFKNLTPEFKASYCEDKLKALKVLEQDFLTKTCSWWIAPANPLRVLIMRMYIISCLSLLTFVLFEIDMDALDLDNQKLYKQIFNAVRFYLIDHSYASQEPACDVCDLSKEAGILKFGPFIALLNKRYPVTLPCS